MSKASEKFYKRVAQEGKFTLLSEYKGPKAPIVARCNECGAIRTVLAGGFFRHGCSHGKQHQIAASKKRPGKTNNLGAKYIAEIEAKHPVQVVGEYTGYREPLRVRFIDCGHEQDIKVDDVLFAGRTPKCKKCTEDARQERAKEREREQLLRYDLAIINRADRMKAILDIYKSVGYEVLFIDDDITAATLRCGKCGHEFKRSINDLSKLYGCQVCGRQGNSLGAQRVSKYLDENKIRYKREVRFDSCKRVRKLPFDFVIYNSKGEPVAAIEYQGEQHYKASPYWGGEEKLRRVQEADAIKREWCREHGLSLLVIKYTADIEAELKAWFPPEWKKA